MMAWCIEAVEEEAMAEAAPAEAPMPTAMADMVKDESASGDSAGGAIDLRSNFDPAGDLLT